MSKRQEGSYFSISPRTHSLPVKNPALWNLYQRASEFSWHPRDISLDVDADEWSTQLNACERHLLSRILAYFGSASGLVTDKVVGAFSQEFGIVEAKFFFDLQISTENVHAESYALLLQNIIQDNRQRDEILNSSTMLCSVAEQNLWAKKWLRRDFGSLGTRMLAFICAKGIFFHSLYAVIYWMQSRRSMPGLTCINHFVARDTALHTRFGCLMLDMLDDRPGRDLTAKIVREAVKVETQFIENAFLHLDLGELRAEMFTDYVKFVADRLLKALGQEGIYNVENPLPFMRDAPSLINVVEDWCENSGFNSVEEGDGSETKADV